ncbi:MAG: acetyltransferase [Bacteroidetes bacterium]|jgi:sugar O-acyltransferase (sialic acid O-acetyltransferase NeuD family)|nr:acetyltransferase [Bacteroidota bacterium]MBT5530644.1 acetyltransferase [Cytophagia bacterium]
MNKKIAIIGHGGFGREVLTIINAINQIEPTWEMLGFFDDQKENELIDEFPYLGSVSDINLVKTEVYLAVGIGISSVKKEIVSKITNPMITFATLIHPSVIFGNPKSIKVGKGTIIGANSIITTNVEIGNYVLLNLACTVGHDTIIRDYSSFMPTVNISGEVVVNAGVYVGTGVQIINQLQIGEDTVIGAGSVVTKNLPANCTAVGIPANIIKQR